MEDKPLFSERVYLERLARDTRELLLLTRDLVRFNRSAEVEIPESIRRFVTYMHDLHHIKYMYEDLGLPVPNHVARELERCDDRYRQLLKEQHKPGETFEKVRREMAKDDENRWDHTRQLEFKRSGL